MTTVETNTANIPTIIKTLRLDRGLSLRELAHKAGVTASYLSKIENNLTPNITINVLAALCHALEADPKLFLDDKLQKAYTEPLDWKDFFLVNVLHNNGETLTSEQKQKIIDTVTKMIS